MSHYLGIDFGSRRIGLSFADELGVPVPLTAISGTDVAGWSDELEHVVADRKVTELVVGYPLNMDGSAGTRAKEVDAFAAELEKRFGLPVHKADERLTSRSAADDLKAIRKRLPERKSGELDSAAATLLLRDFLEERLPTTLPNPEAEDAW